MGVASTPPNFLACLIRKYEMFVPLKLEAKITCLCDAGRMMAAYTGIKCGESGSEANEGDL
jgi:hypothetical protein